MEGGTLPCGVATSRLRVELTLRLRSANVTISDLECRGGFVGPISAEDAVWRAEGGGSIQMRGDGLLMLRNMTVSGEVVV